MIRTAIVGLGRMGKSHAEHLYEIPDCKVVAACSVVEEELNWAKEYFEGITCYTDFDALLQEKDIDALFIASSTSEHATQIMKGIQKGFHVFCEKPLGINLPECRTVKENLSKTLTKDQVFMLGFVRRFDKAYAYAKQKIKEGAIGEPFLVRSITADHDEFAPILLNYTKESGGIFRDMNVHDIDISRWLLGSSIQNVYAIGSAVAHPKFKEIGDADNTIVTCHCENGKIAVIEASRTACHGHNTQAEVYGTKGILRIGYTPSWSDLEILDLHGIRKECVYTFFDRFKSAFLAEAKAFFSSIKNKAPSPVTVDDGVYATQVAEACSISFKEKRIVDVSEV